MTPSWPRSTRADNKTDFHEIEVKRRWKYGAPARWESYSPVPAHPVWPSSDVHGRQLPCATQSFFAKDAFNVGVKLITALPTDIRTF